MGQSRPLTSRAVGYTLHTVTLYDLADDHVWWATRVGVVNWVIGLTEYGLMIGMTSDLFSAQIPYTVFALHTVLIRIPHAYVCIYNYMHRSPVPIRTCL